MDISALSTPTQMIVAWAMFGILLAWLIIFAALAIRRDPQPKMQEQWDEQPTPAGSFPAVSVQVGNTNPLS